MPDAVVTTKFKGKDLLSRTFKRMGAAAQKFANSSDRSFRRASRSASQFKSITGGILTAGLISRGMGLASRGIRGVTEEFINFDQAITAASAKFPEKIGRGSDEFKALQKVARDVGANTKYSATEAAAGLDFLAMAGFDAKQAMAALPRLTDLATAGNMDLARASDIASDALGAFNLMSKDSAKLGENLGRINDVIAKTITSANLTMEDFYETMKDGAPVATAAGASLEEFSALMGEMANAGIKGSKAGTTLKNMYLQLQKPGDDAKKIFKDLKLEIVDSETGALRPMIDILGDLGDKTKDWGKAQRGAAIETIFGKRAIAGTSVLLAAGRDKLKAYEKTLIDAKGAAGEMAQEIEKSLGNKLLALKSAAIEVGLKFFDAFEKEIPGAIDKAIAAVRNFDVKPFVDAAKTFMDIVKWGWKHRDILADLVKGWIAYKLALKGVLMLQAGAGLLSIARGAQAAGAAAGGATKLLGGVGAGGFLGTAGLIAGVASIWVVAIDRMINATEKLKNGYSEVIRMSTDVEQKTKNVKHLIDKTMKRVPKQKRKGPKPQRPTMRELSPMEFLEEAARPKETSIEERQRREKQRRERMESREAPNKTEVEARKAEVNLKQYIDVNAPPGTEVKSRTESRQAGKVDTNISGLNKFM